MVSCVRLVSRCPIKSGFTPVAVLPIRRAKRIKICRRRSLGDQVRVEELVMSDLIIGVVVDVGIHLVIHNLNRRGVVGIATAAWDFVILDAAEFVVLDPKVGLDQLQRRWEAKQGRVSR